MRPKDVPAGPLLVDTDVFSWIAWSRDRHAEFGALVKGHVLALSFATVAELRAGAIIANWREPRKKRLEELIASYVVVPVTDRVTREWAAIYKEFRSQLRGDGINDMWTAACALAQDPPLPVATGNLSDFARVATKFPLQLIHPDL